MLNFAFLKMNTFLIAGGSGLVGSKLVSFLLEKNYKVKILTTNSIYQNEKNEIFYYWNPINKKFPNEILNEINYLINFCGSGIFDKNFTNNRKKELLESRIIPLNFLVEKTKEMPHLKHFISASAIGVYPNISNEILSESSQKGDGFIANLVEQWEAPMLNFNRPQIHKSILRIGIVLSEKGGFLKKLIVPIKMFFGAMPGKGKQLVSWIHIDYFCKMIIFKIENQVSGIFNGTAGKANSLGEISKMIAKKLNRPSLMPYLPIFLLKIIFGKERHLLLLTDQKVSSDKIKNLGFKFEFDKIDSALNNLLKK